MAPNVRILAPISQVHRPLVLLGAVDGLINVLADSCPRLCLLERLTAALFSPGGVTLLTDIHLICAHTHIPTQWLLLNFKQMSTVYLPFTGVNRLSGTSGHAPPSTSRFPAIKAKHSLMTSQVRVPGLRRKLCCISQSEAVCSLNGSDGT